MCSLHQDFAWGHNRDILGSTTSAEHRRRRKRHCEVQFIPPLPNLCYFAFYAPPPTRLQLLVSTRPSLCPPCQLSNTTLSRRSPNLNLAVFLLPAFTVYHNRVSSFESLYLQTFAPTTAPSITSLRPNPTTFEAAHSQTPYKASSPHTEHSLVLFCSTNLYSTYTRIFLETPKRSRT